VKMQQLGIVFLLSVGLMFTGDLKAEEYNTFKCDELCQAVVKSLRQKWGSNAQIYWNEVGFVVISVDGYVSEFRKDGTTIHFGFIK